MAVAYRNGKPAYYRSFWRGGKATKQYVASGMAAELVADIDGTAKEQGKQHREAEKQARLRLGRADELITALDSCSNLLVHAALLSAGFHQHKREWRLKRGQERTA